MFAQKSGLNVYCVRPRIVFARCSKRCARAIVIRKDNSLSGKVSIKRKVPLYGERNGRKNYECNRNGRIKQKKRCFDVSYKLKVLEEAKNPHEMV